MDTNLGFPLIPASYCPKCSCKTLQTNKAGQHFCSREKCNYRNENPDKITPDDPWIVIRPRKSSSKQ